MRPERREELAGQVVRRSNSVAERAVESISGWVLKPTAHRDATIAAVEGLLEAA